MYVERDCAKVGGRLYCGLRGDSFDRGVENAVFFCMRDVVPWRIHCVDEMKNEILKYNIGEVKIVWFQLS